MTRGGGVGLDPQRKARFVSIPPFCSSTSEFSFKVDERAVCFSSCLAFSCWASSRGSTSTHGKCGQVCCSLPCLLLVWVDRFWRSVLYLAAKFTPARFDMFSAFPDTPPRFYSVQTIILFEPALQQSRPSVPICCRECVGVPRSPPPQGDEAAAEGAGGRPPHPYRRFCGAALLPTAGEVRPPRHPGAARCGTSVLSPSCSLHGKSAAGLLWWDYLS